MSDGIREKVDALADVVAELRTRAALTDLHVLNHENLVREFIQRSEREVTAIKEEIKIGFAALRADNAVQTDIIKKWGTIRDTLGFVGGIVLLLIPAVWAVFYWATDRFWPK